MNEEQQEPQEAQKDSSPAQPTEAGPESAQVQPTQEPAPVDQAQTEDSTSESVPQEASDDVDPDAEEPGDSVLPEELERQVHEGEVPPDNVDQEG